MGLKGAPGELSFYALENYWTSEAPTSDLVRYTLWRNGFLSVHSPTSGGEIVIKPLKFKRHVLSLNFASSAAGEIRFEIQDEDGTPIPGYAMEDGQEIIGMRYHILCNGTETKKFR